MTVGERIRILREKRGLSMAQLAKKAGVCPTSITNWENDVTQPHIDKAVLCAQALGTTVEVLTGHAEYCRDKEVLNLKRENARLRKALATIRNTVHSVDSMALEALFPEEEGESDA